MNHKRSRFISEYLLSGNATEAARKAGYSRKTAYSQGQRLLKNVEVMNEIKRLVNGLSVLHVRMFFLKVFLFF